MLQEKYKEHPDDMEILKQLAAALSKQENANRL